MSRLRPMLALLQTAAPMLAPAPLTAAVRSALIVVSTTADDATVSGACTLREAIHAANTDTAVDGCSAGSGSATITLAPGSTSTLSLRDKSGQNVNGFGRVRLPLATSRVTIEGNGSTI